MRAGHACCIGPSTLVAYKNRRDGMRKLIILAVSLVAVAGLIAAPLANAAVSYDNTLSRLAATWTRATCRRCSAGNDAHAAEERQRREVHQLGRFDHALDYLVVAAPTATPSSRHLLRHGHPHSSRTARLGRTSRPARSPTGTLNGFRWLRPSNSKNKGTSGSWAYDFPID